MTYLASITEPTAQSAVRGLIRHQLNTNLFQDAHEWERFGSVTA
jgi:hypothetical protein